jgi:hypothetical protein
MASLCPSLLSRCACTLRCINVILAVFPPPVVRFYIFSLWEHIFSIPHQLQCPLSRLTLLPRSTPPHLLQSPNPSLPIAAIFRPSFSQRSSRCRWEAISDPSCLIPTSFTIFVMSRTFCWCLTPSTRGPSKFSITFGVPRSSTSKRGNASQFIVDE